MNPLRSAILAAARSDRLRTAITAARPTRAVVDRFVAGETSADALRVASELVAAGCVVSLDHLGEDVTDASEAGRAVDAYREVIAAIADAGLTDRVEVSVKLSALGQALGADGERIARDHAAAICTAAAEAGTTVTVDAEDHTTTDSTLRVVAALRETWPWVGAVLQAQLRRTEDDCRALTGPASRVRLCKGAYAEPESVAYDAGGDVRASFARCAGILLDGAGHPMFATHDPALVGPLTARLRDTGRDPGTVEFQMLYGVRPDEQRRLVGEGHTVRVYVPYGTQWYGYLMRRLAERPANVGFFLRALAGRR
ncbi:MAG: proline dehydrogenase family protein [Pseudonocardia sp.]|uniref:proline dehydrogenase family protein n=1 Tax=unclassified Pseudonocardia TaxID=2619320 RepID=UPI00086D096F|nr:MULTISPECIES: proline dehydrogenase family protein [unclassified Pseudonocardia]MBN9108991.1 proline dehydrogenase family protein [Pseudonocardia sp.]ODU05077.1 MAG: proline dehydrogenase [Pseudonocardia sp. SCN 72-51]ODU99678.1 MAG: proline dehydrogenase [Pseudonocardia sp. SCN 73-27]